MLGIVAAGLVPLMQERLTQGLVELAMHVLSTASIMDFVTAVLQVIASGGGCDGCGGPVGWCIGMVKHAASTKARHACAALHSTWRIPLVSDARTPATNLLQHLSCCAVACRAVFDMMCLRVAANEPVTGFYLQQTDQRAAGTAQS